MKDKFKKFVRQHWIFIWALLSVVYAEKRAVEQQKLTDQSV